MRVHHAFLPQCCQEVRYYKGSASTPVHALLVAGSPTPTGGCRCHHVISNVCNDRAMHQDRHASLLLRCLYEVTKNSTNNNSASANRVAVGG